MNEFHRELSTVNSQNDNKKKDYEEFEETWNLFVNFIDYTSLSQCGN